MRTCSRCLVPKLTSEFRVARRGGRETLTSRCIPCIREDDQKAYASGSNGRSINVRLAAKRSLDRNRRYVWDYLTAHPCVDCGETDPVVLTFDHVRGEKITDVSRMIIRKVGVAKLQAEIDKCDVRCSNCHLRRTARSNGWYQWGYSSTGEQGLCKAKVRGFESP